jgi:two-component system phosphate regulon sensor histidine kinase PhoR
MLAINGSAARIFGVESKNVVGSHVLMLNRSVALQQALEQSKLNGSGQATLTRGASTYQVLASQVTDQRSPAGTVVLISISPIASPRNRCAVSFGKRVPRAENTADSILGYAEIMRDGVAKQEDTKRFAGKIYAEAAQLMSLIEDIIRLSQLDEKTSLPEMTTVDLKAVVEGRLPALATAGGKVRRYTHHPLRPRKRSRHTKSAGRDRSKSRR